MKFTIEKSVILEGLTNVIKAISTKNVIPILNGIMFTLKKDGLYLLASDSELTIKTFIDKKEIKNIENEGSIVVQSKYIIDIVRKMPSDLINFEVLDGLKIRIYTENNQYNLNCLDYNDYPNIKIDDSVIEYIANSCTNDVRHIEGTINRLMAYTAMVVPERVTLEFAVEALKDFVSTNIYSVSNIEKIQKAVADYYGITVEDLKGKRRSNKIAYPRQIGMYLCRMETNETFPKIGLEFGGRDHSTVIFACDKIEKELKTDEKLKLSINEIKNKM